MKIPDWYFFQDHKFFCGCDICKRMKALGFNENQAKAIVASLETAHQWGGDAGGAYSDFEKEALPEALDTMEIIFKDIKEIKQ